MKKLALHWQIIIGLVLGLLYGMVAAQSGWGSFTTDWIAPFGTIFINPVSYTHLTLPTTPYV